ncbi:MAG: RidA family protein [Clostridia bacterium]|nr:RidA family protein [Clostridia bacterium]MBQ3169762.1 RidA family protein [Clostridia bacterium]
MKKCFNTERGPKAVGPYSTCTYTEDTVFVSGMIPINPETGEIVEGGVEAQAKQSLENIKTVLEEMGLSMAHVLKTTVLLTDLDAFGKVNAIYGEYFAPNFPARACFEVSRLPKGAMIEIEAVAARNID